VRQISEPTGVEATFLSNGQVVASTLAPSVQASLAMRSKSLAGSPWTPFPIDLGGTRYLATTENLSATATSPLQLVVLKSFEPAERSINRIDRMVLIAGFLALLSGTALMIALSRLVTRPLEELSRSVRAFGVGDGKYRIPSHGTQEVRELSTAFAGMRGEIQQTSRALLESERLATIGRMASSVSHDLRHYLAAIYANAEFLASDRLSTAERGEIFADIRTAVHGTTDMIESLLIFSRTDTGTRQTPELMATLLEHATALVRTHPDAEGVTLVTRYGEPTETAVGVDGKQIERAIFNLLLNACQSARAQGKAAEVLVSLQAQEEYVILKVVDNGGGVPESIRNSLFEPFVSEGKQKGTGLGLTLAHRIAVEHGGEVVLLSSRPGETIFQMTVARRLHAGDTRTASDARVAIRSSNMRTSGHKEAHGSHVCLRGGWQILLCSVALCGTANHIVAAQTTNQESLSQKIQELTDAMTRTQAQLEQSQHQLDEMRRQLAALESQMKQGGGVVSVPATPATESSTATNQAGPVTSASQIQDIRERQALQQSQIATHEQTKVESESKYPVKITGLLLLNGFVNTNAVDMAATPTLAVPGSGSTGASVRQTVLGFDARGPHLFGASSYADLRVDFDGSSQSGGTATTFSGYFNTNTMPLRLRTAHAGLRWEHTDVYFSLDRPIFSPDTPTSLTAVAEPSLAWSGNLWTWNPQLGLRQDVPFAGTHDIRLEAALIDVGDAPLSPVFSPSTTPIVPPTGAEQSRWPGVEARVALLGSKMDDGSHFGAGGYFAPHLNSLGYRFNSFAGTLDTHLLLPAHFEFTGSFYRGRGLGGLGGGAYKDFVYRLDTDSGTYYFRPLDDMGGWVQLKKKVGERMEFNGAFGMDNAFSHEMRYYAVVDGSMYQNLARNRTFTANVIYSPSAYLMFSLEYRHLESFPVVGLSSESNILGLAAGYKF